MKKKEIYIELNQIINECQNIDQDDLTIKVEKLLNSVKEFTSLFIKQFHLNVFYRARVHDDLFGKKNKSGVWFFNSEQEFWHREPESITKRGRCNDIKESFLYCSTDFDTTVIEARPKEGMYISVSRFTLIDSENYNGARTAFIGAQYLSKIPLLQNLIKLDKNERDSEFIKIDEILDELFHQNVKESEEHLYKMSIAVTKCMMKELLCDDIKYPMHAMLYPSIQKNKEQFNIIYKPIHARTHFEMEEVMTFFIDSKTNQEIKLISKRSGKTIKTVKFDPFDYYKIKWEDVVVEENYFVKKGTKFN